MQTHTARSSRARIWILGALTLALASTPLAAHDFWIEPSRYQAAVGSAIGLALRVGQNFYGDAVPRNPALIESFVIAGPDGTRDVTGREGVDPAGLATLAAPGVYVAGYRSRPSSVELDAAKFETYLKEEGLESIIEQRKKAGRGQSPGLEIFSRCAKTIVMTEGASGPALTGYDRVLGLRLELIPETNPYAPPPARSKTRDAMTFRLVYEGQPLAGALVVGIPQSEAATVTSTTDPPTPLEKRPHARTDAKGRVTLTLAPGVWLVKAVHMIPAPKGIAAEWESLWASVTFERAGARRSDAGAPRSDPTSQAARARR
jgi:uncharacterized GH25 family protein